MLNSFLWPSVPLRNLTLPTSTWNPSAEPRSGVKYVDVSAVSRESLQITCPTYYPGDSVPGRARKIVQPGDTIFATIRPTLRRIAQVPKELDNELVSTAFCVLRPDQARVDADFLFYAVQTRAVNERLSALQSGASYPAVRDNDVLDQEIPLPSLEDQRLIARVLGFIRAAIGLEAQAVDTGMALKEATIRELFTRGLRGENQKESKIGPIPESWDIVGLGSLGRIGNGSTPKRDVKEYWDGGNYPWLTSAKVYDRLITAADEFVTDEALSKCHLPRVQAGSLVIAITGQGKTLGNCALLGIEATVSQHLAYVSLNSSQVVGSYVRGYLETRYEYLRDVASGGGSTKGALTCAFLRDLPIPLPPTCIEQQEIADVLDAIDQKIDLHKRKKAVLEELFRTLLHKLMTGEVRVSDLDLSSLETPPTAEVTV